MAMASIPHRTQCASRYDVNINVAQFYFQIQSILQCCAFLKYSTFSQCWCVGSMFVCGCVCVWWFAIIFISFWRWLRDSIATAYASAAMCKLFLRAKHVSRLVRIHNCSHYNWLISLWFIAVCARVCEEQKMKTWNSCEINMLNENWTAS